MLSAQHTAVQSLTVHSPCSSSFQSSYRVFWRSCGRLDEWRWSALYAPILEPYSRCFDSEARQEAWCYIILTLYWPAGPDTKGYVKVLADDLEAVCYVFTYEGKPQHAYLAHRSTYSAIIQAADHCRRARGLLRAHTHNLHQRREGTIKRGDFCACLQISVDLSQGF